MRTIKSNQNMAGFGLVELMVSITLGLLLTAAVIQTLVAANTSYRIQDSLSQIQEAGRYAIHFLGKDLRMAGYMGCASLSNVPVNNIADYPSGNVPADIVFVLNNVVRGSNNVAAGNAWNAVPNTDVITLRRATSQSVRLTGNMAAMNANIQIDGNPLGFQQYDYLMITDCLNADLFVANNVSNSSGTVTITHPQSVNTDVNLSKAYGPDAEVFGFESVSYFVRDTGRDTDGGNDIHALYVQRRSAGSGGAAPAAYELVEGVENMQLTFGEDTDNDNGVDVYRTANNVANWENVLSVKIEILLVSDQENVVAQTGSDIAQVVTFNGAAVQNNDGRYRRAISNVFTIRNKLK